MRSRLAILLLTILVLPVVAFGNSFYHGWDAQGVGTTNRPNAWGLATDADGNIYVAGSTSGTIDFGGGVLSSAGNNDIFLARFDAQGNHLWSSMFGSTGSDIVQGLVVDPSGGVIICGTITGTVDFGGGGLVASGANDMYIARFDPLGNHVASVNYGGTSQDGANGMDINASGDIVVHGQTTSPTIDLGGGPIATGGSYDVWTAVYDLGFNHQWSAVYGDAAAQFANGAYYDDAGNIIVTGTNAGTVDFGGGGIVSAGGFNMYIAMFDGNGGHIWSNGYGGASSSVNVTDVAVDASGNVIVCGRSGDTALDFGGGVLPMNGIEDAFLVRFTGAGSHVWSLSAGGSGGDQYANVQLGADGNIEVGGYMEGFFDLGGGPVATFDLDCFVVEYDPAGAYVSHAQFGTAGDDYLTEYRYDAFGNRIVAGSFATAIDFGGGYLSNADANADFFVTKFHGAPDIADVHDVPGDQGGVVSLAWDRSSADTQEELGITEYTVWRSIDQGAAASLIKSGATLLESAAGIQNVTKGDRVIRKGELAGAPFYWELMHTVTAFQQPGYSKAVATLYDSTSVSMDPHYFQVIAHTDDPATFYTSDPDSALSVDNLAPAPPAFLVALQSQPEELTLRWNANAEFDLSHYNVYRGTDAGFVPGIGTFFSTALDTMSTDGSWTWDAGYWYKVSAVDIHENESVFAVIGPGLVTGAGDTPLVSRLEQNVPNPFNPTTTIGFTLRETADVTLTVYDATGRTVRTLVRGERKAQRYDITWDGRDDRGQAVASGVYFYRINAGSFTQTKKMVLLK